MFWCLVEKAQDARLEKVTFLSRKHWLPKGLVRRKEPFPPSLFLTSCSPRSAKSHSSDLGDAILHAAGVRPGPARAQAAEHQEAILRLRRSPRAALGSVDSHPAKFESKILRPCEASLAGKRNHFSKVGACGDRRQQRGARGLIRWSSSGRRLLHPARHQRVRPAAEAGATDPRALCSTPVENRPPAGQAAASPAKPREPHS